MDTISVLLVEEDFAYRKILGEFLSLFQMNVAEAADGRAALEYIRRTNCEIVVTALQLPAIDGLELIRRLRAQRFARPIIAYSGFGGADGQRGLASALKAGATVTLAKPFAFAELADRIRELTRPNAH